MSRPDIEDILEECENAPKGPDTLTRKTIEKICRYALEAEREATEYRLALEGLTPGGSEFFENPQRCVEHIRERFNLGHEARKECVRLRRRMQSFHDVCIRDMNGDGSVLKCSLCGQVGRGHEERHDSDCPLKEDGE